MKASIVVLVLVAGVGGFAVMRSDDPQGLVLRIGCRIATRAQVSADILNATVTGSSLEGAVIQLYRPTLLPRRTASGPACGSSN